MATFEYQHVSTSVAERGNDTVLGESAERVHDDWTDLLNQHGAEGWELVSERFVSEKRDQLLFAAYQGTMKRQSL